MKPQTTDHDPKELLYHIAFKTTSGIVYSKVDAWKYHQYWPDHYEPFVKHYVDYLFALRKGIVAINVTVIDVHVPITRSVMRYASEADQKATTSPLTDDIVARYSFSREDMPTLKGGDD